MQEFNRQTTLQNIQIELIQGATYGYDYVYDNIVKKTGFFKKTFQQELKDRQITANRPDHDLSNNIIQTNKYTGWNFIPKNLLEQFSKKANIYFLLIGIMQAIPPISISQGYPVIYLPLVLIILISMAKDFMEDYKRIVADKEENNSKINVLDSKQKEVSLIEKKWADLRVGNIIIIKQDQYVPGDILLLQSSDSNGMAYIETKNLDGETNLKVKNVPYQFNSIYNEQTTDPIYQKLIDCPIKCKYSKPIPYFEFFKGDIKFMNQDKEKMIKVNFDNLILRGSVMKNTEWAIGLVCYTGHHTKIMLNMFKPKPKKSTVEIVMGQYIFIIFGIQNFLCLICGIWYAVWYNEQHSNLDYLTGLTNDDRSVLNKIGQFFEYYFTWMLIFTNFVPISLLVTLEVVKYVQGIFISRDSDILDTRVQTSNLNEELGQIKHIFSDKTGTLTCNKMDFKQISIGTTVYGDLEKDNYDRFIPDDIFSTLPRVPNVDFRDKLLLDILKDKDHEKHQQSVNTLIFLALCHTVNYTDIKNVEQYNATSPDELALVNFAKFCGFEYKRDKEYDVVKLKDQIYRYKRLHVFDFNSERKRMSTVFREIDPTNLKFQFLKSLQGHQCSQDIQIIQNKSLKIAANKKHYCVLAEPALEKDQRYQFTFKIQKMSSQKTIALGVCQRTPVQNSKYEFDFQKEKHGCFIVTAQGATYSHLNSSENRHNVKEFSYKEGDEIICYIDPQNKKIKFEVKNQKKTCELNIEYQGDYLYPVVILSNQEDCVTIENGQIYHNRIYLFTKGADNMIFKCLGKDEKNTEKVMKILMNFGKSGLRTLLLAQKVISEEDYQEWLKKYESPQNKTKESELQAELENDLKLVGATGIEDKLQREVPETIHALRRAGIKLWVLTGDKVETAINVGYSCKLLDNGMHQFIITEKEEDVLMQTLKDILVQIEELNKLGKPEDDNNALIIHGESLTNINNPQVEQLIYLVGRRCKVVLCCRATPKQKEQVLTSIRNKEPKSSTLAIGDGANDVNMITAAHVGIGIKGVEGQQASRASDYSITEFRFLRKLLFYHGRECYRRNSQIVCYNFYKNVLLVLPQFWFGFTNSFSGQTLYDSYLYQLFNMFFSSVPIMIYAIFDEEVKHAQQVMTENEQRNFYKQGIENQFFKPTVFWKQYLIGLLQAGIIVLVSIYSLETNFIRADGLCHNTHFWQTGTMIFSLVVLVVNLKIIIISFTMSIGYWVCVWVSWLVYIGFWYSFSYYLVSVDIYNTFQTMFFIGNFHFGNILGVASTVLIDYFQETYTRHLYQYQELLRNQTKKIHNGTNLLSQRRQTPEQGKKNKNKITVKIQQQQYSYGFDFSCVDNHRQNFSKEKKFYIQPQSQTQNHIIQPEQY